METKPRHQQRRVTATGDVLLPVNTMETKEVQFRKLPEL